MEVLEKLAVNGCVVEADILDFVAVKTMADAGTSIYFLPEHYHPKTTKYIIPCGTLLPSITLNIGDYSGALSGLFMEYASVRGDGTSMLYGIFHPRPRNALMTYIPSLLRWHLVYCRFWTIQTSFLDRNSSSSMPGNEPRLRLAAKLL